MRPWGRRLRRALLEIDPAVLTGLPAGGYTERDDSFYDVVRQMAE